MDSRVFFFFLNGLKSITTTIYFAVQVAPYWANESPFKEAPNTF